MYNNLFNYFILCYIVQNLNARRGSSDQNQDDDDDDDDDILEDSSDHSDSQSEGDEIIRLQCPPS